METVSGEQTSAESEWSPDELIPFGKYILLERIESGATAAVYRANVRGAAGFERLVAVKRILPHMAGDPEFVDTFVREAKTTARLTHANICPIYELGKVGESLYMAMECVVGKDLRRVRRRLEARGELMPPVMAAWIAARLCDALDYAHNLKDQSGNNIGIIHRDLSPTNIVLGYEGQIKLIDFGLAKAVGRAQQTNVDALKQKLGYMSPEMVRGKPIDARSDIFGVGIALYEMLTGRRLFAGKDDIATLKLVGKASVPPPSALLEDPPEDLELIIMRALERDPDDRWQTAAEMADVLNAFIRSQDPTFNDQRVATWMHELFGEEIDQDRQRIGRLLTASANPEVVKARRIFFSSPSGAAARAKAEVARRMSSDPPWQRASAGPAIPAAAPVPAEAEPVPAPEPPNAPQAAARSGPPSFDEEETGFYDGDPRAGAPRPFDEEPTDFYDGEPSAPSGSNGSGATGPFTDETTQFLSDDDLDVLAIEAPTVAPFEDEEPTTIYFNKEDGVGIQGMLDEINDVEQHSGPLNRPIVAPDIGVAPVPVPAPTAAPVTARPAPLPRPTSGYPGRSTVEIASPLEHHRSWTWPTVVLVILLLATAGYLVTQTPVGVRLGLIPPTTGAIALRTTPAVSAAVKLDDVYRGTSPLLMSGVKPGLRRLAVEAEGYAPVSREVEVRRGETVEVAVELTEERTATEPAEVSPADALRGVTDPAPEQEVEEDEGRDERSRDRRRRVTRRRHRDRAEQSAAQAEDPGPIASPNAPGTLVVNTVPWARVIVDGRDTGRTTPLFGLPLAPGSHMISLRAADGRIHSERIEVKAGETARITHRF